MSRKGPFLLYRTRSAFPAGQPLPQSDRLSAKANPSLIMGLALIEASSIKAPHSARRLHLLPPPSWFVSSGHINRARSRL